MVARSWIAALLIGLWSSVALAGNCGGVPCVAPIASSFCPLSSIASATGLATCSGGIPASARFIYVSAFTATVNWRDDGTPTTTANTGGQPLAAGQSMWYGGDLTAIKFISASGGVSVSFYQ